MAQLEDRIGRSAFAFSREEEVCGVLVGMVGIIEDLRIPGWTQGGATDKGET